MDLKNFIIIIICTAYHAPIAFGDRLMTFRNVKRNTFLEKKAYHSIVRRDVDEKSKSNICKKDSLDKEASKNIIRHLFPLKNDPHMNLDVIFVGKDSETQLLLTTTPQSFIGMIMNRHETSNIYQTTDGGRTFDKLDIKINSASIRDRNGIMISPLDPNWVILISYTPFMSMRFPFNFQEQNTYILVSQDGCKNFTQVKMPFQLRGGEPLLFHPKKKDWIIAIEKRQTISVMGKVMIYGQAFISKDFGKSWKVIMKGHVAATVKWGAATGKEGDEIYMTTHKKTEGSLSSIFSTFTSSSTLTLWRSSDGGDTFQEIIEHTYNFGVQGNFVFASVVFNGSTNQHSTKRILHVSKDSGATFRRVHVPEISHDRFYSVVDMEKGMIFLHVDEPGDTGKGTLYMSGADGLMYTKSLEDHFFTNAGRQTDFAKIESMHGVYITQVLTKDSTLKSVITFDRGLSWQPLYVDRDKYCNTSGECTLHFHKVYSNAKQHTDIQGPLSSSSAPGIIFLHGQAADALTSTAQVWLSTNGGYNWTKIDNNPNHYAIGDYGNLLLVVPRINNTGNFLRYSIDQGRCWQQYKFHDSNDELVIRGLVTEPHSKERTFSLWGYFKNAIPNEREFTVITIHFHGMFSKLCESTDLEEWSPHAANGRAGCFLGEKLFFARPKLDVDCYLGRDFQPLFRNKTCQCTQEDVECDYGYERNSDGKCIENKSIKPIEVCRKGEKMKERFSKGYRRLSGDVCESKDANEDIVQYIDEKKKCIPSEEKIDVFGVVKEEKKLAVELEKYNNKKVVLEEKQKKADSHYQITTLPLQKKGHSFFFVIGILVLIGAVIGVGWYGVKYIRNKRYVKPTYVMSDLLDEEINDSNTIFDSRPKSQRQYKDESDMEDDVMLPV